MCTYDFCYHLFDFFYSKSVSEYDTQSKKFFIYQNFETSLEMKKPNIWNLFKNDTPIEK